MHKLSGNTAANTFKMPYFEWVTMNLFKIRFSTLWVAAHSKNISKLIRILQSQGHFQSIKIFLNNINVIAYFIKDDIKKIWEILKFDRCQIFCDRECEIYLELKILKIFYLQSFSPVISTWFSFKKIFPQQDSVHLVHFSAF